MTRREAQPRGRSWRRCFTSAVAAGVALVALSAVPAVSGDEAPRVQAGTRLFRSLLAADMDLDRRVDAEGRLVVVVFYAEDAARASAVAQQLATPAEGQATATVRELPLVVELASDPTLAAYAQRAPAAVFVAEPPREDVLRALARYGIEHRLVVFSPFEGHVEKGVLGGISVEAKVQPLINQVTLEASRVALKPFFLKVSKLTR